MWLEDQSIGFLLFLCANNTFLRLQQKLLPISLQLVKECPRVGRTVCGDLIPCGEEADHLVVASEEEAHPSCGEGDLEESPTAQGALNVQGLPKVGLDLAPPILVQAPSDLDSL